MKKEKVSRRKYVGYAAGGIVIVAGAAAGAYYATRPPTETPTPTPTPTPTVTKPKPTPTPTPTPSPTLSCDERAVEGAKEYLAKNPGAKLGVMTPSGTEKQLGYIAEEWTKLTGCPIEFIEVSDVEIYEKSMLEATTRTGRYDTVVGNCNHLADYAESGLAMNLDEYVMKYDPEISTGDCAYVPPYDKIATQFKGSTYGFGADGDQYCLFLRKDYYDDPEEADDFHSEYGYRYPPEGPETWEQHDDLVEFFDRPKDEMRGAWNYRSRIFSYPEWTGRFVSKGGVFFDDAMNPMIGSPEGIEALEDCISINEHMDPIVFTGGWSEQYTDFPDGKAFTAYAWPSLGKWAARPESLIAGKIKFCLMPGSLVNGKLIRASPFTFGHTNCVSNFSEHPELAYLFLQFGNSPKISTEMATHPGIWDPWRKCHFTSPKVQEAYGHEFMETYLGNGEITFPDITLKGSGEYIDILDKNIQAAFIETVDPEEALNEVADTWQEITDRYGRDKQLEIWNSVKSNYPDHIRQLHGW